MDARNPTLLLMVLFEHAHITERAPMTIPTLLLLSTLLAPGSRQDVDETTPPSLSVRGEAEVHAAPDRAVVRLGTTAQAKAASEAQKQVNDVMRRATAALKEAGVKPENLQTATISLQPVYSRGASNEAREIVAYRASNTLRVEVDDLSGVGGIIDAGLGAGANELQGLTFELRDDTEQRAEALSRAVLDARRKAAALAEAAGVRLVAVHRVEEGGAEVHTPVLRGTAARALESGTPVEAGQVRVRATVSLTYRIAPGVAGEDEDR